MSERLLNNNWAYPPPYQSGVGLSGTLSTPLSLRYVQTTPTIPYATNEQPRNLSKNYKSLSAKEQFRRVDYFFRLPLPEENLKQKRKQHRTIYICSLSAKTDNATYTKRCDTLIKLTNEI